MSVAEKSIKLYAWKTNYQAFQVIQGEVDSRKFYIQLLNTSVPVNLTNCSVMLFAIKPDSTNVYVDCEVIDAENGIVTVTLTEQMCAVEGTVECWIQVAGEGGTDLRFEGMNIEVVPCSLSESIQSNDDLRAFLEQSAKLAAVEMEVQEARLGEPSLKDKQKSQDAQISGNSVRYDYRKDEIQIKDGSGKWHGWASADIENHCIIKNGNPLVEYETDYIEGSPKILDGYFIMPNCTFGVVIPGGGVRFSTPVDMTIYPSKFLKIVAHIDVSNPGDTGDLLVLKSNSPTLESEAISIETIATLGIEETEKTFFISLDNFDETNKYLWLAFTSNQSNYYIKTIVITSENGTEGGGSDEIYIDTTLTSGSTQAIVTDSRLKTTSLVDLYTSDSTFEYTSMILEDGSLTIEYDELSTDLSAKVVVRNV